MLARVHTCATQSVPLSTTPAPSRYEDLLFNPVGTIQVACECIGAIAANSKTFNMAESAAKSGPGHGDGGNDRRKALAMYADVNLRFKGYDGADLEFVKANWHSGLAHKFHYDRMWQMAL